MGWWVMPPAVTQQTFGDARQTSHIDGTNMDPGKFTGEIDPLHKEERR